MPIGGNNKLSRRRHSRSQTAPCLPVSELKPNKPVLLLRQESDGRKKLLKSPRNKSVEGRPGLLQMNFKQLNDGDRVKRIKVQAEKAIRVSVTNFCGSPLQYYIIDFCKFTVIIFCCCRQRKFSKLREAIKQFVKLSGVEGGLRTAIIVITRQIQHHQRSRRLSVLAVMMMMMMMSMTVVMTVTAVTVRVKMRKRTMRNT